MRLKNVSVVLVVAALAFSGAGSSTTGQNDAGSGADAGDTADKALELSSWDTTYHGDLIGSDPADWYLKRAGHSGALCTQTTIKTPHKVDVHFVAVIGNETREVVKTASGETTLAVASPGLNGVFVKDSPNALDTSATKGYDFNVKRMKANELKNGDGNSGRDAGTNKSTAVPVPAPCFGGKLDGPNGDTEDRYTFEGTTGEAIVLSLASDASDVAMKVISPTGDLLDLLTSGDLQVITLPTTGTYTISMSTSTFEFADYTAAMCAGCGPPEHPCNPMCTELI